tara:strand:+ start:1093 stop:1407 length:315 start_codon:yes stop_codon:yes gene_type:complete
MRKINQDDHVVVLSGRDKGKRGDVIAVRSDGRLIVAGINTVKKHKRGDPNNNEPGGILTQEAPIDASNVAIWNDEEESSDKVGIRLEGGKKVRYYKSTGKLIEA